MLISLLRKFIPSQVRIASYIVVISGVVTAIQLLLKAYLPAIDKSLGLFIPLIVVNCIILGRAEGFASQNPVGESALDGLFMGIGFTLALTSMGIVRELLGKGAIFGVELWNPEVFSIKFFSSSAGAFFTYGLFIAVFTAVYNSVERKNKLKAAAKLSASAKEGN